MAATKGKRLWSKLKRKLNNVRVEAWSCLAWVFDWTRQYFVYAATQNLHNLIKKKTTSISHAVIKRFLCKCKYLKNNSQLSRLVLRLVATEESVSTRLEFTAARCLVTSFRCRGENEKISTPVDETIFRDSSYFCTLKLLLPVLLKIRRLERK